jgi:glutathione synthase/RimK-type ligase-like ATP-grasp enzyme
MLESLPKQKLINPLEVLKLFRSKPQQYLWMESENIPLLPWLSLKGSSVLTIEKFFRLYPEVVVKPTIGQGGWGITILNWMQFKSWWKKKQAKKDEQYLIQPFMRGVQELRYFFIKNGPSYVLERQATTGSVANFKRQGVARLASPRTEIINQLEELVEKSGALYGAIDLFFDGKNISILELNSVPGIEQLESSTQINVMGQLLNAKFFCQSI